MEQYMVNMYRIKINSIYMIDPLVKRGSILKRIYMN